MKANLTLNQLTYMIHCFRRLHANDRPFEDSSHLLRVYVRKKFGVKLKHNQDYKVSTTVTVVNRRVFTMFLLAQEYENVTPLTKLLLSMYYISDEIIQNE